MSSTIRGIYRWPLLFALYFLLNISVIEAASYRVLVVMSYEEDNPWCVQIKEGIDSVFADNHTVKYFYMNTKRNFNNGARKANEAYQLYNRFKPHGVIAADDNAQFMFVLPYLKNKVNTPVMFCAVNEEPEKYGYPASNVSGILERSFISESIAFAKQLAPSLNTVGFLTKDSPSGRAILKQVQSELDSYVLKYVDFKLVNTVAETLTALKTYQKTADALFITATNGILDAEGRSLNNMQVTKIVSNNYKKPLIGANDFHVRYGVLCAVVKSGNVQGKVSAEMLLEAIKGKPIKDMPVTYNKYGKRMLNVTVMQELGIRPKRRVLVGTELVKSTDGAVGN